MKLILLKTINILSVLIVLYIGLHSFSVDATTAPVYAENTASVHARRAAPDVYSKLPYAIGSTAQFLQPAHSAGKVALKKKIVVYTTNVGGVVYAYILDEDLDKRELVAWHHSFARNLDEAVLTDLEKKSFINADNWKILDISPRYKVCVRYDRKKYFNPIIFQTRKAPWRVSRKARERHRSVSQLLGFFSLSDEALFHAVCGLICHTAYFGALYIPYNAYKQSPDDFGPFCPQFIAPSDVYEVVSRFLFSQTLSVERAFNLIQAQRHAMVKASMALTQCWRRPEWHKVSRALLHYFKSLTHVQSFSDNTWRDNPLLTATSPSSAASSATVSASSSAPGSPGVGVRELSVDNWDELTKLEILEPAV